MSTQSEKLEAQSRAFTMDYSHPVVMRHLIGPVELGAMFDRIAELEARESKALACLKLIAENGDKAAAEDVTYDGFWCAEQAREVLKQLKEESK